jgi:hypothetical protein
MQLIVYIQEYYKPFHTPLLSYSMVHLLIYCIGDEVKVADEGLIDMATAVSGTGPAVSARNTTVVHIIHHIISRHHDAALIHVYL